MPIPASQYARSIGSVPIIAFAVSLSALAIVSKVSTHLVSEEYEAASMAATDGMMDGDCWLQLVESNGTFHLRYEPARPRYKTDHLEVMDSDSRIGSLTALGHVLDQGSGGDLNTSWVLASEINLELSTAYGGSNGYGSRVDATTATLIDAALMDFIEQAGGRSMSGTPSAQVVSDLRSVGYHRTLRKSELGYLNDLVFASITLCLGLACTLAVRITRAMMRFRKQACPACGYDQSGLRDLTRCSECGHHLHCRDVQQC